MSRPTTTLHRFAWQAGSLAVGRGAALVALLLAARHMELARYGRFVVLLALLEAAMIPWKPTVQQGAAARLGSDADRVLRFLQSAVQPGRVLLHRDTGEGKQPD